MELLAVGRAARSIAALQRRRLHRRVLDRQSADRLRGHAGDGGRPLGRLAHAVGETEHVRAVRSACGRAGRQMRLVEAEHVPVEERLVVQSFAGDDIRHRDERGGVGGRADEDVLVGELVARARDARIHAHDACAVLLRELEVLQRSRSERPIAWAPAPHDDEPRVDVVARLAPGALVVGLGAVGHLDPEDLGLRRDVRPELGAAAELVQQALHDGPTVVQHREAAGARAVQDRRRAVGIAHAPQLARHLVERLVPRDALELAGATRSRATQWMAKAVGMVDSLGLAESAHARVKRWDFGRPLARIRADLDDAPVTDVGVDDAAAAAVVTAGAGDDTLAGRGVHARRLVENATGHGAAQDTMGRADPLGPAVRRPGRGRMRHAREPPAHRRPGRGRMP